MSGRYLVVVMTSDYRETTLVEIQTSAREMMKEMLNNRKIINKINKNYRNGQFPILFVSDKYRYRTQVLGFIIYRTLQLSVHKYFMFA
jgi:hypothetical protein